MSRAVKKIANDNGHWYADVPRDMRGPTVFGASVLMFAVFGFGVWASTAPIDGAVLTRGAFVATGQNKIVQHLEGGVIHEILVREGDVVTEGQPLIRLDDTAPRARLRRLLLRQSRLTAMEARLRAEAELAKKISFPQPLIDAASDADIRTIIVSQQLTFKARVDKLNSEISVLEQEKAAFAERMAGARLQHASVIDQISLIDEEIESKMILLNKGLIQKSEMLALKRAHSRLEGEAGRLSAEIGDIRERMVRAERQVARLENLQIKQAVEEFHDVESELQDVRERVRAAAEIVRRVEINAPVPGVVVRMGYHTPGGVIEPGKDILELLPVDEELIIEVNVRPQDIDSVSRGQSAYVRLSALNQRTTPMIPGKVIYVSADTLLDGQKSAFINEEVYVARVQLDREVVSKIPDYKPTPGMPAEVYIKTGERTFFKYLTQPIIDSMGRAFRES